CGRRKAQTAPGERAGRRAGSAALPARPNPPAVNAGATGRPGSLAPARHAYGLASLGGVASQQAGCSWGCGSSSDPRFPSLIPRLTLSSGAVRASTVLPASSSSFRRQERDGACAPVQSPFCSGTARRVSGGWAVPEIAATAHMTYIVLLSSNMNQMCHIRTMSGFRPVYSDLRVYQKTVCNILEVTETQPKL